LGSPDGETPFGRDRNQLAGPLIQGRVVSDERKDRGAECQARNQRGRMSQSPSLGDGSAALCQCLVGKAETEKANPQERLGTYVRMDPGLIDKRAMELRIIKRKRLFEMQLRRRKPADKQLGSTRGKMTQNESRGIVALTADSQQIFVQALRQIEFSATHVVG